MPALSNSTKCNAKCETVATLPMFRDASRERQSMPQPQHLTEEGIFIDRFIARHRSNRCRRED
jgi:hypothetical protein